MSNDGGYVVSERFAEAMGAAAMPLSDLGSSRLSPEAAALAEYIGNIALATAEALLALEVRVGPTEVNPAGRAALKAFMESKGIDTSRLD